jgi:predicted nucleic acid-binding protein
VYLIDTNVISETRKRDKANPGVRAFFAQASAQETALFVSVVTVGELRRGVDLMRHRGDTPQAATLEAWMQEVLAEYRDRILDFDTDAAQLWGRLRVPHPEHGLDKQIAATALVNDLVLVTRHTADFVNTGVALINPFEAA